MHGKLLYEGFTNIFLRVFYKKDCTSRKGLKGMLNKYRPYK